MSLGSAQTKLNRNEKRKMLGHKYRGKYEVIISANETYLPGQSSRLDETRP